MGHALTFCDLSLALGVDQMQELRDLRLLAVTMKLRVTVSLMEPLSAPCALGSISSLSRTRSSFIFWRFSFLSNE